ncbi:MAG: cupin domain-containing protein [Desulfopila sp.]
MGIVQQNNIDKQQIGPECERYLCHTDHLMMTVIDFNDGPTTTPDPPHSHHHEQISYVVTGEIIVIIDEEAARLGPGDMFTVPPDVPHSVQLLTKHVRLVDTFTPLRQEFLA